MKKYGIILTICLILVFGFLTGMYLYKLNKIDNNLEIGYITSEIDDECTEILTLQEEGLLESQETNAEEEKVSPNSKLTIKKLYAQCNHIIQGSEEISVQLTNLNQEEFQKEYSDWEIQKFTSDEIVLYKEVDDFCGEHYKLKEENGFIAIYELDKNDNEVKIIKVTDIPTEYLTDTDLINIEKGMIVYTKQELNKILEDFE